MRTIGVVFLTVLSLAGSATAQTFTALPKSAIEMRRALTREKRVRYLLRQLDLNAEQAEHAKGLLETYFGPAAAPSIDVERIRNLWKELEEAHKAGDKAREEALTREIRRIGQQASREPELLENLKPVLRPEQKQALTEALERLKRNPSGGVRPIDIFDLVARLDLTDAQRDWLEAYRQRFRKQVNSGVVWDDARRERLINALLKALERVLTPEQIAWVDYRIQRLRPDLVSQPLVGQAPPKPGRPEKTPLDSAARNSPAKSDKSEP